MPIFRCDQSGSSTSSSSVAADHLEASGRNMETHQQPAESVCQPKRHRRRRRKVRVLSEQHMSQHNIVAGTDVGWYTRWCAWQAMQQQAYWHSVTQARHQLYLNAANDIAAEAQRKSQQLFEQGLQLKRKDAENAFR